MVVRACAWAGVLGGRAVSGRVVVVEWLRARPRAAGRRRGGAGG